MCLNNSCSLRYNITLEFKVTAVQILDILIYTFNSIIWVIKKQDNKFSKDQTKLLIEAEAFIMSEEIQMCIN